MDRSPHSKISKGIRSDRELELKWLVPIFSPGTTKRDVALAYYKGLLEGNFALQQRAYEELEAIKPDALASLGILSEERGDYKQAQKLFQEVMKLDRSQYRT